MPETEIIEVEVPSQYKEMYDELDEELEDTNLDEETSRIVMNMISSTVEQNMELD